ncbi:nicotinamide N-methyltransferase-like protein, partial [Gongronella butleri]
DVSGGCGGKTWPAAYVMINYMVWRYEQDPATLAGKTVIDLGSGTGLVGLALAKGCPSLKHMELTDQEPMMQLMKDNIVLNGLSSNTSASLLDWGVPHDHKVDIVLASDCVYLEIAFQPLIDTLIHFTDNNAATEIYMTYRRRRKADKRFFQLARRHFNVIDIEEDPHRATYKKEGLYLYKL